ncbi:Mitochondrial import inner membrane translocase subunit TIM21 [Colletotrichum gloeosporioides]|uniref:Mitochondrial import inner membrane translocase subunit Tim21 n=1 Tax=Colletotrichum gloeosporioides TaxID=474922 RepID=A0A8H4FLQ0_COLGL|nr:Mitochondrial import inner membrane translocase subunit TIM21 [Colletotrichum gloeosporioides]KAF3806541.1 Mitochondrial import inner membrane translocase subunit TIM21 [Colletotrichum gloeosporioides]
MKMNSRSLAIRAPLTLGLAPRLQPLLVQRHYATQTGLGTTATSKSKRRTVTPFNDTGAVPWSELSAGEKAARATQQTFNFGLILAGLFVTATYVLYTDVFSLDSKTAHFNRVVDRIKSDPKCIGLLGDPKKISAHGDETYNKWRRARPIADSSTISTDSRGHEHLVMHFYVEGPLNRGTVYLHMIRTPSSGEFEYKYLYLDVKGHHRIYLENADTGTGSGKKGFRFLGISW